MVPRLVVPRLVVPPLVVARGHNPLIVISLERVLGYKKWIAFGIRLLSFNALYGPSRLLPYFCPPMSDLERLIDHFSQDAAVKSLHQALLADQAHVQVSGLAGSGKSFVLSGLTLNSCGPWLLISPDKESAAYLQNTLVSLLPDADILFFPDSFKRPGLFEEIVSSQVMERTEAVNKLYQNGLTGYLKSSVIAVTYPEALAESVISPASVAQQQIQIKKGEDLAI